jgi:cell division septum initiation protein DivIVA
VEMLHLLQERIQQLVQVVKDIKAENTKLSKANAQLKETLASMEAAMLKESKSIDSLAKEKEMTKTVVDDLIKRIDSLLPHSE